MMESSIEKSILEKSSSCMFDRLQNAWQLKCLHEYHSWSDFNWRSKRKSPPSGWLKIIESPAFPAFGIVRIVLNYGVNSCLSDYFKSGVGQETVCCDLFGPNGVL